MNDYLNSYRLSSEDLEKQVQHYRKANVTAERVAGKAQNAWNCILKDIEFLQARIWHVCGGSGLAALCDAGYLNNDPKAIAGMIHDIRTTCSLAALCDPDCLDDDPALIAQLAQHIETANSETLVQNALDMLHADLKIYVQARQIAEKLV